MQRDFLKSKIIYKASETTHRGPVIIGIVFVLILIYQIEIPSYNPWPWAVSSDITKFL